MSIYTTTRAALLGIILCSNIAAHAQNKIVIRERDEIMAIREAKRVTQGGLVVSTDHDLTNWDVNILKGCFLHEIEVSHDTGKVVSHDKKSFCGNAEALRELKQQAMKYRRTHR